MSTAKIVVVPHPALRQVLPDVTSFDEQLADLADEMLNTMRQAEGVGLAANQIDRPVRMFVYGIEESQPVDGVLGKPVQPTAVVNPIITVVGTETNTDEEGCLSIPHLYGPVTRSSRVKLEGYDLTGKPFSRVVTDYEARVVQHETDHLNGVLFLDRMTDPTKLRRA